jgi:hypothetical protein
MSNWEAIRQRGLLHSLQSRRRKGVDPTTCAKDYSSEEIAFMKAMDQYRRANGRRYPAWSEVLEVLHALGYRKVEPATALPGVPLDGGRGETRKR